MNGHLAWLAFADLPGALGAGSDGVCSVVREEKRMAMSPFELGILVGAGASALVVMIIGGLLTLRRRMLEASE